MKNFVSHPWPVTPPFFPCAPARISLLLRPQFNDSMSLLAGKLGIVFGVANKRSIAWAIAQAWRDAGAKLAFTYQGERLKDNVEELVSSFGQDTPMYPCDVTKDE